MDLVRWAGAEAEQRLSSLGARWAHTKGVVTRARALAETVPPADRELLIAAAYLHDIGYDPALQLTGFHPLDGAAWLRAEGQDRLAGLVAHHSRARFEAEERGLGAELDEFPEERSPVADLLTYCDLTTGSEGERVTPSARLAGIESRHGADSDVTRAMNAAAEQLGEIVARTEARIARHEILA
jgi:putative nucleotidyltransferase with HDIG domain